MWPPSLCSLDDAPGPIGTSNWLIRPSPSSPSPSSLPGPGLIAGSHPGSIHPHENELNLQTLITTHHVTAFVNLLSTERLSFVSYEPRASDLASAVHRTLTFLTCPIVDGGVAEDELVLHCCQEVAGLLEQRHVVYVHCWGGHGRTGVVIAIVLGLVYGIDGASAIDAASSRHNQRAVQTGISSPQSPAQVRQVLRILSHVQVGTPLAVPVHLAWLDAQSETAIVPRRMLSITPPLALGTSRVPYEFSVLTWNTLASSLCNPSAFPSSPPSHLLPSHRRPLFMQEFRRTSADLICLMEVDGSDFDDFFFPFLHSMGYDAFWVKKPAKESMDGTAMAYAKGRLAMMGYEGKPLVSGEEGVVWNSVCAMAQFAPIAEGHVVIHQRLVVAALHLKAKVGHEQVRLRQSVKALQLMEQVVERLKRVKGELQLSTLLVGDFNDTPGHSTPVWQYVVSGQTPATAAAPVGKDLGAGGVGERGMVASHPFWFHSLYDRCYGQCSGGKEYWTTVKRREERVQRAIDFIFYSPLSLLPLELLSIPDCDSDEGYPAREYPSDHLALVGRFQLLPLALHHMPVAAIARHKL